MDMQCIFLSALIYKKPVMRGTAALFTNRKLLKQAPCVLFEVCFPPSLFSEVFWQPSSHFHTLRAKQENFIQPSGVTGICVSPLSWRQCFCVCVPVCLSPCLFVPRCSFLRNVIIPTSSVICRVCPSACVIALSAPSSSSPHVAQRPKMGWRRCRQWGTDTMSVAASHVCLCVLAASSQQKRNSGGCPSVPLSSPSGLAQWEKSGLGVYMC